MAVSREPTGEEAAAAPRPDASGLDVLDTSEAGSLVIRGGVVRIAGYALNVGLSVVGAAVLIRYLGAEDFGRYTAVVSVVTVVAGLIEAGMTNIGVREYSVVRDAAARAGAVSQLLGLRLVLALIGGAIAVAFAAAVGYDDEMVVGTAAAAAGLLATIVQATYGVPLQARLRLGSVTAIDVLRQVVTVALIAVLVVAGASLVPLLAVPAMAAAVALVATFVLVRAEISLGPAFSRAGWGEILRVTLPYAAATGVGVVYVYLTVVLISLVSTNEETGYFGAAFRVFVVLGGIPGLLVVSAFPVLARAARDDRTRLAYALQRLFDVSLILGVGLAVLTLVGAPLAIDVIGGDEVEPAVDVLRIQAGAVLGSCFVATWGFALLSLARYRALLAANALALGLSATLTLALAPTYGAEGGAVATLVAESALALASGVALIAARPDLRPSVGTLPKVAVAGGAAAATLLVPGLPVIVDLALAAVAYGAAVLVLRAVPEEILEALVRPLRAKLRAA